MSSRKIVAGLCIAGGACFWIAAGCGGSESGAGADAGADHDRVDVGVDHTGGSSSSGGEAGSGCYTTGYTPLVWLPPSSWGQRACTDAQITDYQNACFVKAGPGCDTFVRDPANAACVACVIPDLVMNQPTAYGPVIAVATGPMSYAPIPNFGGCTAHFDGMTAAGGCGNKIEDYEICGDNDCRTCGDQSETLQCFGEAQMGECSKYFDMACESEQLDGGTANICGALPNFIGLWCGGGDGGAGDGGSGDAAADAEADGGG
jgi:hypothetical protein